ncbi:unannotated protein [freshwater metagenome]|uniref:Unannotated protein n=1 Tax=freshwater metagenome TaxID=449393 RepID=A0A6J6CC63_9ZZZZ
MIPFTVVSDGVGYGLLPLGGVVVVVPEPLEGGAVVFEEPEPDPDPDPELGTPPTALASAAASAAICRPSSASIRERKAASESVSSSRWRT